MTPEDLFRATGSLTVKLEYDDGHGWSVHIPELEGCITQGDTVDDALWMLSDAMHAWAEVAVQESVLPEK